MMTALRWSVFMAFAGVEAIAAACGDRDVVTCADCDGELEHAASETAARPSEIAIATDLPDRPAVPGRVNAAVVVVPTAIPPGPAYIRLHGLAAAVRGPGGGQRKQCSVGQR